MNFRYPVFLDLAGKRCLVIGENPHLHEKIVALREAGALVRELGDWNPEDLTDVFLVVASLSPERSAQLFAECERRNILLNANDDPPNCRFAFGSLVRRGDLTIAISTNGQCPALAVRIRERFEAEFGPEYSAFLELCGTWRDRVKQAFGTFAERRRAWYSIVDSSTLAHVRGGDMVAAEAAIEEVLAQ